MNPNNKFSKLKEDYIIKLYESGKTQKEIAGILNTYNTTIRRILLRNNIILRSNSDIQTKIQNKKFKGTNSDYFLGLIITDGCISNNALTLSLQQKDYYILENFAKFLGKEVKVNKYFHKTHNKYQYYVKGKNIELMEYLKTLANFNNKSKELELYRPISWEMLRGIFDGDGSVVLVNNDKSMRWFVTSASEIFINQIYDFLKKGGYNPTITSYKGIFCVNLYRKKELNSLFENLYNDTNMFLKRKHIKMATFLGKPLK